MGYPPALRQNLLFTKNFFNFFCPKIDQKYPAEFALLQQKLKIPEL
jgi:hypothetical protein